MADFKTRFENELNSLDIGGMDKAHKKMLEAAAKPSKRFTRRHFTAIAAVITVLAVLGVGASAVVQRFYVPQKGILSEYPYEIYALEEGFYLGSGYIDTILRTTDDDGRNIMTIHAIYERTKDARDIPELLLSYADGTVLDTSNKDHGYGRRNAMGYAIYNLTDVPPTDSFTLTLDGEKTEITLLPIDRRSYGMTELCDIGGVGLMLYPLPGGGNSFAVYTADNVGNTIAEYFGVQGYTDAMSNVMFGCLAYDDDGNTYKQGLVSNEVTSDGEVTSKNQFVIFNRVGENVTYNSRAEAEAAPVVPISERIATVPITHAEINGIELYYAYQDADVRPTVELDIPEEGETSPLDIVFIDNELVKVTIVGITRQGSTVTVKSVTEQKTGTIVNIGLNAPREQSMSQGQYALPEEGFKETHFDNVSEDIESITVYLGSLSLQYDVNENIVFD